ncbi:MAG: UDP-N-acetylglucosamine 2-epimerase [candidate division WOR-3 bacterium]|nr:UDP-N-acetylglucosamine 2-epimerase [candidate division WOR-3 bacterium]
MKTIMIISTARSDFSHLSLIIRELRQSNIFEAIFTAAGSHFDISRGCSITEIEQSGISADYTIEHKIEWHDAATLSSSLTRLQQELTVLIRETRTDYIMVLGDRIELVSVLIPILISDVKLIHISGGEETGCIDDKIRNLLSLTADISFTSGELFRENIIRMKGSSRNIYNAGDPALENIDRMDLRPLDDINREFGLELKEQMYILFTFHPETDTDMPVEKQIRGALEFMSSTDRNVLCTAPNSDIGGDYILDRIKAISKKRDNIYFYPHLGYVNYISLLASAVSGMGNSSSLVIEAPYLRTPSVLIGSRQIGRPLADSVFQAGYSARDIKRALISATRFTGDITMYYERKDTAAIIREILEQIIG